MKSKTNKINMGMNWFHENQLITNKNQIFKQKNWRERKREVLTCEWRRVREVKKSQKIELKLRRRIIVAMKELI